MKHKIGEIVDIQIDRQETGFDKACDQAFRMALMKFGADDKGNLTNVFDTDRSRDIVMLEFVNYTHAGSMAVNGHLYVFKAWVDRAEDEDEEDDE